MRLDKASSCFLEVVSRSAAAGLVPRSCLQGDRISLLCLLSGEQQTLRVNPVLFHSAKTQRQLKGWGGGKPSLNLQPPEVWSFSVRLLISPREKE